MMDRSCFLSFLLVSLLLVLSFSHGSGRQLKETVEFEDSNVHIKESGGKSRMMAELMDYNDPGPNTNPRTGYIFSPPPQAN